MEKIYNKKVVMCKGNWPEDNFSDFEVFEVKENETDKEAIKRAESLFIKGSKFYIIKEE